MTIPVKGADGSTYNVEVPNANGQQLMAASRPVVIASNQSAIPVTDNAGSITVDAPVATPLFVRLSDGAAAVTPLIGAQLPSSLGTKTAANSLAVTLASDGQIVTATGAAGGSAYDGTNNVNVVGLLHCLADIGRDNTTPALIKIDQTGTNNNVVNTPASTAYALIPAPSTYRLLSAAATTNGANIKGSAGAVKGIQGYNAKASAVYLKLYNKTTAPTVGTDTPVKTIYLPPTAAFAFDFGTGVGFATGIGIALTGAGADNDTTALASGDILALNVDYH